MSEITRTENLGVSQWRSSSCATGGKFWVAQPRHLYPDTDEYGNLRDCDIYKKASLRFSASDSKKTVTT